MKISSKCPKIVVIGSCSIDLVLNIDEHPLIGETFVAKNSNNYIGGKGANEAVAVSRLGAETYFIGCVGMDPMGQQIMHHLVDENVNIGFVRETGRVSTGSAYVLASNKENTIVVDSGANNELTSKHIAKAEKHFQSADFILIQLETPLELIEYLVNLAKKYDKKIALYASPAREISLELLLKIDYIIIKKRGVEVMFKEAFSNELLKKFPNKLLVRACNTTSYFDGNEVKVIGDESIELVHKMGIGDAFVSGFAIALCHDNPIEEAVIFGNKVALKVSQKRGSQTGLPYLKDFR